MSYDDTNFEYCTEREPAEVLDTDAPAPARHPQRPLDDFEVRRTPAGAFEIVYCGSRHDEPQR